MWQAAEEGDDDRVREFLLRGKAADERGRNRETALCRAAENGHTLVVSLLLLNGASVDDNDNRFGVTALHNAAGEGHEDVVRLLLDFGASRTILDRDNHTADEQANERGYYDLADLINEWEYMPSRPVLAAAAAAPASAPHSPPSPPISSIPGSANPYSSGITSGASAKPKGRILEMAQASLFGLQDLIESVQSVQDLLECPICLVVPHSPVQVLQCKSGHVVCSTCRAKMAECPQCRAPFGNSGAVRNRRMEEIIEKFAAMGV